MYHIMFTLFTFLKGIKIFLLLLLFMFEVILAGFSGSFFSYFCAFMAGAELHAYALGTYSGRVIDVMYIHNRHMEDKMDKILKKISDDSANAMSSGDFLTDDVAYVESSGQGSKNPTTNSVGDLRSPEEFATP